MALDACADIVQGDAVERNEQIAYEAPTHRAVYFTGFPEYLPGADAPQAIYNALVWASGFE